MSKKCLRIKKNLVDLWKEVTFLKHYDLNQQCLQSYRNQRKSWNVIDIMVIT